MTRIQFEAVLLAGVFFAGVGCSKFSPDSSQSGSTAASSSNQTPPSPAPGSTPAPAPAPLPIPVPPSGKGVVSVSANTFLSSIGVNTHIAQGFSGAGYIPPLKFLGARSIRDGESNIDTLISVHQQTGITVAINGGADLSGLIANGRTLASAGALLAIEGPNEPNNFPISYQGQIGGGTKSWLPIAYFQRDLYKAVKSDSILKNYPVFHVSEGGAETNNVGMQFLTIPAGAGTLMPDGTQYADYANPHNYVCSTQSTYVDNQAWNAADPTLNSLWDGLYVEYGRTWWSPGYNGYSEAQLQTLPRVTTETGYDSVSNPGGEAVQGVVLANTYLAQFKRGWRYTFIYELVDGEGSSGNQGLFHGDLTPKPAANYIHNMTTILADTGTLSNPGQLDYSIVNPPSTVHDLLLQKNNGTFELVIWSEKTSGSTSVTVNFGGVHGHVSVYDITLGTSPTQSLMSVSSVPLSLTNHAVILEIVN